MAKLVDEQVVGEGRQGLFVALQRGIAQDAIAVQLHPQRDPNAVARILFGVAVGLKNAVGVVPDEALNPRRLQGFASELR